MFCVNGVGNMFCLVVIVLSFVCVWMKISEFVWLNYWCRMRFIVWLRNVWWWLIVVWLIFLGSSFWVCLFSIWGCGMIVLIILNCCYRVMFWIWLILMLLVLMVFGNWWLVVSNCRWRFWWKLLFFVSWFGLSLVFSWFCIRVWVCRFILFLCCCCGNFLIFMCIDWLRLLFGIIWWKFWVRISWIFCSKFRFECVRLLIVWKSGLRVILFVFWGMCLWLGWLVVLCWVVFLCVWMLMVWKVLLVVVIWMVNLDLIWLFCDLFIIRMVVFFSWNNWLWLVLLMWMRNVGRLILSWCLLRKYWG